MVGSVATDVLAVVAVVAVKQTCVFRRRAGIAASPAICDCCLDRDVQKPTRRGDRFKPRSRTCMGRGQQLPPPPSSRRLTLGAVSSRSSLHESRTEPGMFRSSTPTRTGADPRAHDNVRLNCFPAFVPASNSCYRYARRLRSVHLSVVKTNCDPVSVHNSEDSEESPTNDLGRRAHFEPLLMVMGRRRTRRGSRSPDGEAGTR
jgi:hypothetical protein